MVVALRGRQDGGDLMWVGVGEVVGWLLGSRAAAAIWVSGQVFRWRNRLCWGV